MFVTLYKIRQKIKYHKTKTIMEILSVVSKGKMFIVAGGENFKYVRNLRGFDQSFRKVSHKRKH